MKRPLLTTLALAVVVTLGSFGCSTMSRERAHAQQQRRPRAFALAVTVNRVLQPTPAQWAAIQAKVADELAQYGYVLVTDLALADSILRIDFTPNPSDPENSGHAQLLGIRPNPLTTLVTTTSVGRYPTSFSYLGSFQNASWGYGSYNNLYGWNDSWYNGYSYGSANLSPISPPVTTRPTQPPHRPQPGFDNCPAPGDRYVRSIPARFAGDYASTPVNDQPSAPGGGYRGRWRSDNPEASSGSASTSSASYVRRDASYSRSDRTYARGDSSYTRPQRYGSESSDSRPARSYSSSDSSSWRNRSSYESSSSSRSYESSSYSRSYDSSSSSSSSAYSSSSSSSPSFSSNATPVSSSSISTASSAGPAAPSSSDSGSSSSSSNQNQH